jgi:PAS domain S-box-containing protein
MPWKMTVSVPADDARRLAALRRYDILDTGPEEAFDEITRTAARMFEVPISLVSLDDGCRHWFKSHTGWEQTEIAPEISFCSHALLTGDIMEVPDATLDERFSSNPLVSGAFGVRFYAGAPLVTPDGFPVGTLCLVDVRPKLLTPQERDLLRFMGNQVVALLELRRKATELARREEQLENAFDAAGLGVWEWDIDSGTVNWSSQAKTLLGLPASDELFSLESLRTQFLAEDVDQAEPSFNACISGTADRLRIELRAFVGGSAPRWFQFEGRTHRNRDSDRRRMTGVIRDVTAQKARDEVIRTSERHFRSYFEMPLVGFAESTPDMRWIEANPRFCEMMGYTWDELHGRSWASLTHPEDLASDLGPFEEVIAGRSDGYSLEKRYVRKDGSILHAEISVRCLRRPDGSAESFAAMVQDISERKHTELALRENERRLSLIFNNATDAMVLIRVQAKTEFHIVSANARFVERLSGQAGDLYDEDIVGRPVAELTGSIFGVDAATGHPTVERLARIAEECVPETFEERIQGAEGMQSGETVLTPVSDSSGRCVFILYSSRDITERDQARDERDLLEAQLRQAQKMEAIGTLAGGIAHDFNNILGAIMAYTDLALMDQGDHAAQKEDFAQIMKGSDRARKLVEQILSFSQQQKQERRPVRLKPVLTEVLRLLRSTLPASVNLDVLIQPDTPTVLADPTQIHQIIINLSTNASHAMRGEGTLGIRLEGVWVDQNTAADTPDLRVGPYALLTLTDTGHGMPAQTMKRIFEPFFTTKPPGEGTGLGLSVTHGIVKEHEGAITVASQPGHGTTFRIYFPEHAVPAANDLSAHPAILGGQGALVLVVDDEPAICHAVGGSLQRIGYEVALANSARQGLEIFSAAPEAFDAVITDLNMPGMTGPDLAARLFEIRPGIPVFLATGFSAQWNQKAALEFGFRDILHKPVSITTLAQSLHRVLHHDAPSDPVLADPVI